MKDSTHLVYRSKDTVLRWRGRQEERWMRGHSRLLALVRGLAVWSLIRLRGRAGRAGRGAAGFLAL